MSETIDPVERVDLTAETLLADGLTDGSTITVGTIDVLDGAQAAVDTLDLDGVCIVRNDQFGAEWQVDDGPRRVAR
jgi:hypothetical protein